MIKKPLPPSLSPILVDDAVRMALAEDFGRAGDITTDATIPVGTSATAVLVVRDAGVIAGLPLAAAAFRALDPSLAIVLGAADGETVERGRIIAQVDGSARAILAAERVALNYLMHLSGVATYTARFAAAIAHTRARVTCTRKTIPGMRTLEKYAVRCGGGSNHRFGLDDAILIKDNHIAVSGGVAAAIRAARAFAGHLVKVEVEVDTIEQMREALDAGPDVILLDNMDVQTLRHAVEIAAGRVVLEASGNVALDTIAAIAETGVDYISTSKITMAAPTLDIGLDIVIG